MGFPPTDLKRMGFPPKRMGFPPTDQARYTRYQKSGLFGWTRLKRRSFFEAFAGSTHCLIGGFSAGSTHCLIGGAGRARASPFLVSGECGDPQMLQPQKRALGLLWTW